MGLFTHEWNQAICKAWNTDPNKALLSGAGIVEFVLLESEVPTSSMFAWDSKGKMRIIDSRIGDANIPTFSATIDNWDSFIGGEFKGVKGVISGKLRYSGSMVWVMRFGSKFDFLAVLVKQSSDKGKLNREREYRNKASAAAATENSKTY